MHTQIRSRIHALDIYIQATTVVTINSRGRAQRSYVYVYILAGVYTCVQSRAAAAQVRARRRPCQLHSFLDLHRGGGSVRELHVLLYTSVRDFSSTPRCVSVCVRFVEDSRDGLVCFL